MLYNINENQMLNLVMKGGVIMELSIRGKNLEITEALRQYVEKHTGKIQRYFDKPIKMNVLLRISI